MPNLPFYLLDVFAEKPFTGNQLAVFYNAIGLETGQMQQIANEIALAESVFVQASDNKSNVYPIRIFTPEREVPFAGHPVIGTANVIKNLIQYSEAQFGLGLQSGILYPEFDNETCWVKTGNPEPGFYPNPAEVLELFGLLGNNRLEWPCRLYTLGIPFIIVPLQGLHQIASVVPNVQKIKEWLINNRQHSSNSATGISTAFYLFCTETNFTENQIHARMFCLENDRIIEDSATGSASLCLMAYLFNLGLYKQGTTWVKVEQGFEMGRYSIINLEGTLFESGELNLRLGGKVKMLARGAWFS